MQCLWIFFAKRNFNYYCSNAASRTLHWHHSATLSPHFNLNALLLYWRI